MFKKQLVISLIFLLGLVGGCVWVINSSPSKAQRAYEKLMSQGARKDDEREVKPQSSQVRQQVSKQILYNKGGERLQIRLKSDRSELIYLKKEGELVENFQGVACVMQEEVRNIPGEEKGLFRKQQLVRELKSDEATYIYNTGNLEADDVEVAHYLLPGSSFPESLDDEYPLFKGKSKHMQLSLYKEPRAHLQGFRAIIHNWGGL